jgi:hypothetical protein
MFFPFCVPIFERLLKKAGRPVNQRFLLGGAWQGFSRSSAFFAEPFMLIPEPLRRQRQAYRFKIFFEWRAYPLILRRNRRLCAFL